MAARNRNSTKPAASSDSQMTYSKFMGLFPDDAACLEYLRQKFYPDGSECPGCGRETKFHRIKSRAAYSCQYCGHQVYPTAGTIFHKSTTSLQLWFWAIYLISSTRCGISAKQLEREIGVSYPTAHRMFKQIRSLLSDNDGEALSGQVEADETHVGGKARAFAKRTRAEHRARKAIVVGAVKRKGRVRASVVPSADLKTLGGKVKEYVLPRSILYTDESPNYLRAGLHYDHRRIYHQQRIYVAGNIHTQTIEGFFGLVKNGIRGVYHSVSKKYLQSYLDEYTFRYNRRDGREPIFWAVLDRVQKDQVAVQ